MGSYTSNYNLYLPSLGEQGWGNLVNQNFVLIDQNLPITANDGSKWFVNNASYDKSIDTWTQIDTVKGSSAIHLRNDGYGETLTCAAGNASITWSTLSLDMKNVYSSTGTVNFHSNELINVPVRIVSNRNLCKPFEYNLDCSKSTGGTTTLTLSFPLLTTDSKCAVTITGSTYGAGINGKNNSQKIDLNLINSVGNITNLYTETQTHTANGQTLTFTGFNNDINLLSYCSLQVKMTQVYKYYSGNFSSTVKIYMASSNTCDLTNVSIDQ